MYIILYVISSHRSALHNNDTTYKQTIYDIQVKTFYIPVRLQLNNNDDQMVDAEGNFFLPKHSPKFLSWIRVKRINK